MCLLFCISAIAMQRLFLIFVYVNFIFYKKKRKKWHFLRIVSLFFDVTHSEYVMWLLLSIFAIAMQRLLLIFASVNLIFYKKKRKKWHFLRIVSLLFDVTHSEYVMCLLLCIFTIAMQRLFLRFASVNFIFYKKKKEKSDIFSELSDYISFLQWDEIFNTLVSIFYTLYILHYYAFFVLKKGVLFLFYEKWYYLLLWRLFFELASGHTS
jgi:hypothetical protein